jgi:signal recognition particle subunit SRP54
MTKKERSNPEILNPSRKKRIAAGAGVNISEVNALIKQFEQSKKMMKQLSGMMGKGGKRGKFKLPFGF